MKNLKLNTKIRYFKFRFERFLIHRGIFLPRLNSKKTKKIVLYIILFVLVQAGLLFYFKPGRVNAAWFDDSWKYRKLLVVDHTKVSGSTDLTNFPVLVSRTDTDLRDKAQTDGDDIIFTDVNGQILAHEIESYTSSTGALVAWVKTPTLYAATSTVLYMYYGNPSATNLENSSAVWDSNYQAVWHMNNNPAGTAPQIIDSTDSSFHGTTAGSMVAGNQVAGKVDGSIDFDGANDQFDAGDRDIVGNLTFSSWVNLDVLTAQQGLISKRTSTENNGNWSIRMDNAGATGKIELVVWTNSVSSDTSTSTGAITADTWYYVTVTYASSTNTVNFYINGAAAGSDTGQGNDIVDNAETIKVGFDGQSTLLDGTMDEIRLSDALRSADWIATEYENQNSPSTFFSTVGSEEKGNSPSLYYKFDEAADYIIHDNGSNKNHGWSAVDGIATQLRHVENGSATYPASTNYYDVTLSTPLLDTEKAFLVFSANISDNSPRCTQFGGNILNKTTIRFERYLAAGDCTTTASIEYYVAEYYSGVYVQRGSNLNIDQTGTAPGATETYAYSYKDIQIKPVDITRSVPLITYGAAGSDITFDDFTKAVLTSSTNLRLMNRDSDSLTMEVEWQVIEFANANVQSGTLDFGTSDSSKSTALSSAVNTAKTIILGSITSDTGTAANIGQKLFRGYTDGTNITFERTNTGQAMDITWYTVEFTDNTTVQTGTASFTTSDTVINNTITAIDTARTIALTSGYHNRGGETGYSANDNLGVGTFILDFTSTTNLRTTRGSTGPTTPATADATWYAVEFPTGTIPGAVWQNKDECISESCLYFDGANDGVVANNNYSIDLNNNLAGAFSVSTWIRVNSDGENNVGQIFSKGANTYLRTTNEGTDGKVDLEASLDLATSDATVSITDGITLNKWHHVVLSYSDDGDDEISIYIDGMLRSTSTNGSGAPAADTNHLYIAGSSAANFHGTIDEFKIYNKERSASEVKTDYIKGAGPKGSSAVMGKKDYSYLSDRLVGKWNLDENTGTSASDSSGNSHTGTLVNSPSWTTGKFGTGINFPTNTSYILVDDHRDFRFSTDLTIAIWIKKAENGRWQTILEKADASIVNYWLGFNDSDNLSFSINPGTSSDSDRYYVTSSSTITDTNWHHVAVTYNGAYVSMYIDGSAANTPEAHSDTIYGGTEPVNIGRSFMFGTGVSLNGTIDELRMYNRALAPTEIQALYNWSPDPIGYWNMDENKGNVVNDRSSNGHQITLPPAVTGVGFVKSVEYVEVTLSTSTSEVTDSANLSLGQNIANSVPFVTSIVDLEGNTGDVDDFSQILSDVYFESGPDRVTVNRANGDSGTGTIIYGIYVVEFDPEFVSVQQGVLTFTGTSDTDTVTAVNQAKAAMLFYYKLASPADVDGYDGMAVAGWFSNNTTLSWQRGLADGTVTGHYYIFEARNDEFAVQADSFSISSGSTSNTAALSPSVDLTKSFVIGSYRADQTGDNPATGAVSIYLDSTSTVGAARTTGTDNITDIRTFTVSFAENEIVQRGSFAYGLDDGQEINSSLTTVNLDYAFAWNPNVRQGQMLTNGTGSAHTHEAFQRLKLTNSTTIQGDRHADSASTATGYWEVLSFPTYVEGTNDVPEWSTGKYGGGLKYDTSDDYISLADHADFDFSATDNFTVSAWVKHNGAISTNSDFIITKADTTNGGYKIYMDDSGDLCFATDDDATWDTSDSACTSAIDYDDNEWHYVTGIKTGTSKIELYVDGILVATDSSLDDTNTIANSGALYLGIDSDGLSNSWDGSIDEVKFYRYARTPAQIVEDMNAGHPAPGSPIGSPLTWWKFDNTHLDSQDSDGLADVPWNLAFTTACPGGSTCPTPTDSGKIGKALSFDGADDNGFIRETETDLLLLGDLSISTWINPTSIGNGEYIIHKGETGSETEADNEIYFLRFNTTSGNDIEYGHESSTGTDNYVVFDTNLSTSTWYHVSLTRNSTTKTVKLYINGVLKGTSTYSANPTGGTGADIGLGANDDLTGNFYHGIIDEMKIYALELTADQVKLDFNQASTAVWGAKSTASDGITADFSAEREYCVPGDTSTCSAPVGEWKFDENSGTTAYDSSGNGNNGTLLSDSTNLAKWVPGKHGSALEHDDLNTYVRKTSATGPIITTGDITISAWVYRYSSDDDEDIIDVDGGGTGEGSNTNYNFYINGPANTLRLRWEYSASNTDENVDSTVATSILSGQWVHYAVTRNTTANTVTFYENGKQLGDVVSYTNDPTGGTTTPSILIGSNSAADKFNGKIDEIRVFNYVRTPAQIVWDYNRGGPTAWYKFDECQGTSLYDASGNSINGTITIGGTGTYTTTGACNSGVSTEAWNAGSNGKFNSSLGFDGSNDYVNVASPRLPTGDFSYSVWFYQSNNSSDTILFANNGSGGNEIRIYRPANSGVRVNIDDATHCTGSTVPSLNTWNHFIVTRSSGNISGYLNGKLDCTGTDSDILSFGSCPLLIGADDGSASCNNSSLSEYWEGFIDDIRVYNYALTTQQIKTLINGNSAVLFAPFTGTP